MSNDFSQDAASSGNRIRKIVPSGATGVPSFLGETHSTTGYSLPLPGAVIRRKESELDALTVAERIVDFCHEHGDLVSNLKLQKLLYYCQAWYLALHGKPLFYGRFEARPNGPVQPDVHAVFRRFGDKPIEKPLRDWQLPKKVEQHIADLMIAYGRLSAFELERLACQEEPWLESRQGIEPDESSDAEISMDTMKRFYKSRLNEQKSRRQ